MKTKQIYNLQFEQINSQESANIHCEKNDFNRNSSKFNVSRKNSIKSDKRSVFLQLVTSHNMSALSSTGDVRFQPFRVED